MNLQQRFKKASFDRDNDKFKPAIEEYSQIRKEALNLGQKELAADCLHMTGISYSHIEDYSQAEEYFKKAQKEFEADANNIRIGAVLRDRGSIAASQDNLDKAEELMQQSIDTLNQTDSLNHLGMSKVKMGMIYLKQGKLNEAEEIIKEGIKDLETTEDNFFHSTAFFNLAEVQKELKKTDEARKSLNQSLSLLNQIAAPDEHSRRRQKIEELMGELDSEPSSK